MRAPLKTIIFLFYTFLSAFTSLGQDPNSGVIFEQGWKFARIEDSYTIDNSTKIWHAMLDGNVLNAILLTKDEKTNAWTPQKLKLSHYEVYSSSGVGYARYKNEIVRFRIEKNKKLGYQYFMDKLVNLAFEKASTPFHTEEQEGEKPAIEDVIITDRIHLIIRNRNEDYSISTKKIKAFDSKDLKFIDEMNFELSSKEVVIHTSAISNNNKLGFVYFDALGVLNVDLVNDDELQSYVYETDKDAAVMNLDYPRISEGNLRMTCLENPIDASYSLLSLDPSKIGEISVLDQKKMTWDELFRDYPDKLHSGNETMLKGTKRRTYDLTNVVDDGNASYLVYVGSVAIIGTSNSGGQMNTSVWGFDHGDLLVVKIENDKIVWMQAVRRSYRQSDNKDSNYLPIAELKGDQLQITSRDNNANFDEQGSFVSGVEQKRAQKYVNTKVTIDAETGEIISHKVVQ